MSSRIITLILCSFLVSGCYMTGSNKSGNYAEKAATHHDEKAGANHNGKKTSHHHMTKDGNPEKAISNHHHNVAKNAAEVSNAVSDAAKKVK